MKVEDIKLDNLSPLYRDYIYDFARVEEFFQFNPHIDGNYSVRYDYLRKRQYPRQKLVAVLKEYNQQIGCNEETLSAIESLLDDETMVVVTGQQAGVMTGPLYTIYKIVSAIKKAQELREQSGFKVVPVFWLASEDHDFQEINHTYSSKHEVIKNSLHYRPFGKLSIGSIPMKDEVEKSVIKLIHDVLDQEGGEWITLLEDTAKASDNLAQWCARLIAYLFRSSDLIIIDPMLPGIRELQKAGMLKAVENQQHINNAFFEQTQRLSVFGYKPAIEKDAEGTNLFIYQDNERLPLVYRDEGYGVKGLEDLSFSKDDIERLISEEPVKFSSNVLLRPILQDLVLPTIAYVAGPGEIAYYAQFKKIYPIFGLEMPIYLPRVSITLVPPDIKQVMKDNSLEFADFGLGREELIKKVLTAKNQGLVSELFNDGRQQIQELYAKLSSELVAIDANLEQLIPGNLGRVIFQLEYLEKKTWQKVKKQQKQLVNNLIDSQNILRPNGHLQERTYSIFKFLNQEPQLIEKLLALDLEGFQHKVLEF